MNTDQIPYEKLPDFSFEDTRKPLLPQLERDVNIFYVALQAQAIKCGTLGSGSPWQNSLYAYAVERLYQIGEENGDPVKKIRVTGRGPYPDIGLVYFARDSMLLKK